MKFDWKNKLKPGLPKQWLYFFAGIMWSFVGLMLISFTFEWFDNQNALNIILFVSSGIVLALTIYRFGFSKLAIKNIKRVENIDSERPCVFAFQQWSSYPVIIFMDSLGIFFRNSPIPKPYLAVLYIGIGGSLFLSSLHYFNSILKANKK